MKQNRAIIALLVFMLVPLSLNTQAQELDKSSYLGVSLGFADREVEFQGGFSGDDFTATESGGLAKVYYGIKVVKEFGFEASFTRPQTIKESFNDFSGTPNDADLKIRDHLFTIAPVGYFYSTEKFEIFGKIGATYIERNIEVEERATLSDVDSFDDDGWGVTTGVGATYDLNDKVSLRSELEYLRYTGKSEGDELSSPLESRVTETDDFFATIGVQYNF